MEFINIKKHTKFLIIFPLVFFSCIINAQENKQSLFIGVGGGSHSLKYDLQDQENKYKGGVGYLIDVDYSYFMFPQWGIKTGVGLQSFNSSSILKFSTNNPEIDTDGDPFEFRAKYNWKEKQNALFVELPLAIQFRQKIGKKDNLLIGVGGKIGLPIKATYKVTSGEINVTGYYSQYNLELSNMPQNGFPILTDQPKGDISFKTAYMLTTDIGETHNISKNLSLYVGGYFNYGLNNILKPDNKLIYQYDGTYNGVLASAQTNKVLPISFGVKVGIVWDMGCKKSPKKQEPEKVILIEKDTIIPQKEIEPVSIAEPEAILTQIDSSVVSINESKDSIKQDSREADKIEVIDNIRIVPAISLDISDLHKYNVVIGSFIHKYYALALKNNMMKEGYKVILARNEKGMFRVIVATFDNSKDAVKECQHIKSKYAPRFNDIWILKIINDNMKLSKISIKKD